MAAAVQTGVGTEETAQEVAGERTALAHLRRRQRRPAHELGHIVALVDDRYLTVREADERVVGLGVDGSTREHIARDDAEMTARVLQASFEQRTDVGAHHSAQQRRCGDLRTSQSHHRIAAEVSRLGRAAYARQSHAVESPHDVALVDRSYSLNLDADVRCRIAAIDLKHLGTLESAVGPLCGCGHVDLAVGDKAQDSHTGLEIGLGEDARTRGGGVGGQRSIVKSRNKYVAYGVGRIGDDVIRTLTHQRQQTGLRKEAESRLAVLGHGERRSVGTGACLHLDAEYSAAFTADYGADRTGQRRHQVHLRVNLIIKERRATAYRITLLDCRFRHETGIV